MAIPERRAGPDRLGAIAVGAGLLAEGIVSGARAPLDRGALLQLLGLGLAGVVGLGALLAVLALWTGSGAADGVDLATGTVTLALSEEPPQLDATRTTDQVSGRILGHVMEGLLRYDARNQLVPGVAESWEIGETTATFRLRADAVWSNGEPVTAHDFVFAWRKALDPANASQYAFILYPLKNGEAINRGQMPPSALAARAEGDRTLVVELERPVPYFAKLLAFPTYFPINEAFYRSREGRYAADAEDLLYNGPFTIARWVHGASVRLEKNLRYWNADAIRLNAIDYAYITSDANAALNFYKDGKIAMTGLNSENLRDALQNRWNIRRFADGSVFFMEFNYREGRLTRNWHLRRALQLVNDPAELVYKVIKVPGNLPGESLFPVWLKGVRGYFRQEYPAPTTHVDEAEARRHLELAKEELGLTEMPPLVMLTGDSDSANKQSEYYQNVFKRRLGLDIKIDRQIFKQRLAKMTSGEFDIVMAGWGPDYDDPMTFGDLFASWNENNRGRYANPELDAAVDTARSSMDPKVRMDAMAEVQRILHEDAVLLVNYERGSVYVANPQLKGVVRRAVGTDPDFTHAWIETPAPVDAPAVATQLPAQSEGPPGA